jgi:hypothetical protein
MRRRVKIVRAVIIEERKVNPTKRGNPKFKK